MSRGVAVSRAGLAQLIVAALLGTGALALLPLHDDHWWTAMPPPRQWSLAAAALLVYAVVCAVAWRRARVDGRGAAERRSRAQRLADAARSPVEAGAGETVIVAYATQTGFAAELAARTAGALSAAGRAVRLIDLADAGPALLGGDAPLLLVASTTGEGDPPDRMLGFAHALLGDDAPLPRLRYAVLALGDRGYARFCAFGHAIDDALRHRGATPLFDLVEVDNGDPAALRHWQHHLAQLAGDASMPDWAPPAYEPWTLRARTQVNPGSPGAAMWWLTLQPQATAAMPAWEAGDIAEIGPRDPAVPGALLPHREYSIASVAADRVVELLVREVVHADGTPGIGSGWLCRHAAPGGVVDLRIRRNANFHPPDSGLPLLLVGNGTGIAGLRAHLRHRAALEGAAPAWLVFGERSLAHDRPFADEIDAWLRSGVLARCDLVFSRDATPPPRSSAAGAEHGAERSADGDHDRTAGTGPRISRGYVQHLLAREADALRRWIDDGAALLVCGSLAGMAPAVDAVLRGTLGDARVDALVTQRRYRRDVY